jgi:xanthine dehydrogenase accessory factor
VRAELLQLAADLARKGEPFVLAVVVRRESYSSAHQGDMAVITADGGYHGWLGGNCTQPAVKREARRALADGRPRLVSLSPEPASEPRPGVTPIRMTCSSGGSVEIYLEPVLPAPRLVVFGPSPVARALALLGKGLGWMIDVVDPAADRAAYPGADRVLAGATSPELRALSAPSASGSLAAVVATMGESDEESLEAALALGPAYLGVVASRKRFALLRETLLARGARPEELERIRNPAGLDLGAVLPEELALSILGEIVQLRRAAAAQAVEEPAPPADAPPEETDPVCGMTVAVATARHRAEHEGRTYLFCNARCREKFLAAPARYLAERAGADSR